MRNSTIASIFTWSLATAVAGYWLITVLFISVPAAQVSIDNPPVAVPDRPAVIPVPPPPGDASFLPSPVIVAPSPAAATQNTINTQGPVTSETTISVGTLAGQVLEWAATFFGGLISTMAVAWLYKGLAKLGVETKDLNSNQLQAMAQSALNLGAHYAAKEFTGRGQLAIRTAAIDFAVNYIQRHGKELLKAMGLDPVSPLGVERIKAEIQTAIIDPTVATAKVLDIEPPPVPNPTATARS